MTNLSQNGSIDLFVILYFILQGSSVLSIDAMDLDVWCMKLINFSCQHCLATHNTGAVSSAVDEMYMYTPIEHIANKIHLILLSLSVPIG